ncbi:Hint domain-containing protein [Aliiroseovarius crassostreae]|uniref:Hint domain-containing protein n=1 Tax=Aliiroseovarius crassostreae TaxID=154981 RepID=UPI0022034B88|nr:Hint domain-containing protein [Aliiroseovarius crassostreae]UWP93210.1 Hint domain-containing protein [Aliiroseovarius crassostreae]
MTALTSNNVFHDATSAQAGLTKGTIVLTLRGEVAVEDLREGDRIITRDVGAQPLRAIEQSTAKSALIQKGSLGANIPERDTRVAAEQAILLRGEKTSLVSVSSLAGEVRETLEKTTLYRLIFDRNHVIYANGAELTTG